MKTTRILYWVLTGLFSFVMLGSGIADALIIPEAVQGFKEIGLPAYLVPFLGWAKILGVAALLLPGFPRLKEWAYAGLIIDLAGATWCVAHGGKDAANWLPIPVFIAIGLASYYLYHQKQRQTTPQKATFALA